ncbi:DnaB-like helicase C-terminal domain-containing protein [Shimia sp.]|uniref:DnaB-like helicase C-terminal domain-containing protein n=1 Tax=Shimia sp. TaxID=1954381 RepID=UPI003BAB1D89
MADEPDDSVVPRGDRVSAKSSPLLRGSPQALAKRGITEETCKKWGYIRAEFNGRNVHVAQYKDENGRVVSQKIRLPNKDFVWRGPAKEAPSLYGKWLWKSGGKKIIVTEGEIDALTVSQLQGNKWPVVSVKDGAGSAPKAIRSELQYLNSFDEVILMFDMDEPGQDAVEKCVGLFPPGKCYVASLPHKDANECLLKGAGKEVINAIWNAKEYRPDSIINPAEMWDDFISVDEASSIPYPFDGLNVKTMGLRQRELTTITAGSGIGKSSLCREIAHWIVSTQGQKLGYIALEESWKKTMQELVGIEMNTRLIKADPEEVDQNELKEAYSTLTGSGNLYLYNHFGSLNSERLLDHIRYMASGLGVGWVVLDHLSIVVSGDDGIGDERRAIDVAMTKLRSLVEETGIGLILVSHLKRPDGKGHEEGAVTSLAQLRGSAAIAQLSDMVLGLERNQQDPENADRTQIRVLKNRFTGETGEACGLVYDHQTGRLSEDTLFEDESGDTDSEY